MGIQCPNLGWQVSNTQHPHLAIWIFWMNLKSFRVKLNLWCRQNICDSHSVAVSSSQKRIALLTYDGESAHYWSSRILENITNEMQLNKWLQNIIFAHFTILHDLILCMCICVHAPCMHGHISFVYKYIIICKIFQKGKKIYCSIHSTFISF